MSKWRVVPAEPTEDMLKSIPSYSRNSTAGIAVYRTILTAAPAFEPDDAMVERALDAYVDSPSLDIRENIRAALKAAFEEPK